MSEGNGWRLGGHRKAVIPKDPLNRNFRGDGFYEDMSEQSEFVVVFSDFSISHRVASERTLLGLNADVSQRLL